MTITTSHGVAKLLCESPDCDASVTATFDRAGPKQVDQLRRQAATSGWSRYRPKATAPLGDYCPACTAKILESPV